ncbi:MAG: DUF2254 domain-containing protein [Propionibacteriaceae bacterium]|nr:DUF2254 domain-containing protein [Propionibacteriaceae bacterium]
MTRLSSWWYRTRESFWFVPLICLVSALVLAQGMVTLDRAIPYDLSSPWFAWVYGVGIDGSRAMLGAIGTSMLAVAATAFSITISVVVTASATYGPRLVGNFMADRGNQIVLGVLVATFVYALMVLRTIRSEADDQMSFVPHLAVNLAVLMAVADAVLLVWFIHHIAASVRVETLAHGVRTNLRSVVERMHPQEAPEDVVESNALLSGGQVVDAGSVGYLVEVDFHRLRTVAREADAVLKVIPRVGDHILASEPLVRLWPSAAADDEDTAEKLRDCVRIGDSRSVFQDVRFAEQQVLELAVRALSPGTNDPYTAVNAIEEVAAGVALAVSRARPGNTILDEQTAWVHFGTVSLEEIVDMPFDQIRPYAMDHVMVVTALMDLASRVRRASVHPEIDERMNKQVEVLVATFRATEPPPHDMARVEEHLALSSGAAVTEAR